MEIIKRKKGNQEYFYLKKSYRKKGKSTSKEIYLGKKIPKNISEIQQKFSGEFKKDLYEKLGKIRKNFQIQWDKLPESAKKREKQEIAIAFTYNTNAIEGSTITLEEAREIIQDKISPNKPLRDVKETEAHANLFLKILDKKEKITNKLILKWHKDIFQDTKKDICGKYRDYLVGIGNYIAPDWQDVKKLMNQLIKFIEKNNFMNPVELSARAHFKFEKIHPFGDGNGRIGRLISNFILWHSKYPMLIIEYKKRKSYYKAFQKTEEDFVNYYLRRYLAVHKKRI